MAALSDQLLTMIIEYMGEILPLSFNAMIMPTLPKLAFLESKGRLGLNSKDPRETYWHTTIKLRKKTDECVELRNRLME